MYVWLGHFAAWGWGQQEESEGGEGEQTPYGLEELEFLAHVQDADPEQWKVERWHRSYWFCSAADAQRSAHGYEDKNSFAVVLGLTQLFRI